MIGETRQECLWKEMNREWEGLGVGECLTWCLQETRVYHLTWRHPPQVSKNKLINTQTNLVVAYIISLAPYPWPHPSTFNNCSHSFANFPSQVGWDPDSQHTCKIHCYTQSSLWNWNLQLLFCLLLQCILSYSLECLFHVDSLFSRRLKIRYIAFRLTPSHRTLLCYLKNRHHEQCCHNWKMGKQTCRLFSSTSILLPSTTKGKFSGSCGLAWIRNSSRQLSNVSKDFALLTSYTRTQQSAPR